MSVSPGACVSIHARSLGEKPGFPGRRGGDDDPVERLRAPQPLKRVDERPPTLDPCVDRHSRPAGGELDRLEDRHRALELVVLDGCLEAELERHDDEVRGHEQRVLRPRDPQCGVEHRRVELPRRERDEQARLPGSTCDGAPGRPEPHW